MIQNSNGRKLIPWISRSLLCQLAPNSIWNILSVTDFLVNPLRNILFKYKHIWNYPFIFHTNICFLYTEIRTLFFLTKQCILEVISYRCIQSHLILFNASLLCYWMRYHDKINSPSVDGHINCFQALGVIIIH